MPQLLAAFGCGLLFGAGLLISGMTQPDKVLGFLDIFGAWDATLAFVMAGAVIVTGIGFALVRRRGAPVLAAKLQWPTRDDIDAPLIAGAAFSGCSGIRPMFSVEAGSRHHEPGPGAFPPP